METLYPCCAGLDVHKQTVTACVRRLGAAGKVGQQVRTFGTMTGELLALSDWLAEQGVTHVAMESTGVYWKPIFNILEGRFRVLLVNARHIKQVPGRKTDVKDCAWIAQLLQHGLLRASFVPPRPVRELRDLTRQRARLVEEKAAVANRIQKVLEDANIKLAGVASDVLGASGRDMLRAIVAGEADPGVLANLARQRLRDKLPQLRQALAGRVTEHHRFLLGVLLEQVGDLERLIDRFNARIAAALGPLEAEAAGRLSEIPGFSRRVAEVVLAEVGADMGPFPSADHLCSWAGALPRQRRERGPVAERADDQGEPVAAGGPGAGGLGRQPQQGDGLRGAVPAAGGPAGQEARAGGVGAHDAGHRLPPAEARGALRGAGARLPGALAAGAADEAAGEAPGKARASGDTSASRRGRLTGSFSE